MKDIHFLFHQLHGLLLDAGTHVDFLDMCETKNIPLIGIDSSAQGYYFLYIDCFIADALYVPFIIFVSRNNKFCKFEAVWIWLNLYDFRLKRIDFHVHGLYVVLLPIVHHLLVFYGLYFFSLHMVSIKISNLYNVSCF